MRVFTALIVVGLVAIPLHADAGSSGAPTSASTQGKSVAGVVRDVHGKIKRDMQGRHAFRKSHPCPSTGKMSGSCPGHVIDHVTPLKRGGADSPGNMQWQTREAAKEKDRWE